MPTYIKAGFWKKARKTVEGELNLDNLISSLTPVPPPIPPALPYKSYVAIVSQSGTSAPTVDVLLENTLGDTITFTYANAGEYYINSANNKFTNNKTVIMVSPGRRTAGGNVTLATTIAGTSLLVLYSHLANGTLTDSLLSGVAVEIRVYN
jgi:hypothetical protein